MSDRFLVRCAWTAFAVALGFSVSPGYSQTAAPAQVGPPAGAAAPSPVAAGLAYLKNHQPQEALAEFQQALQANPNDVGLNLYAAGAALELYQGDLAVQYAEKAKQLDPNNWKVHTTLVAAYARAGKTEQRDAEREYLRKLHADPKAPDAMQTSGFLIEMFPAKAYHVDAIEYFQPVGKFHIYYRFLIRNQQGSRMWEMVAESNDFDEKSWEAAHADQAATGERQFQIVGEGPDTHVDYRLFSGKPAYDAIKAQILQIINAQTAPFPGEGH